jgi:hypothetical protein
MSPIFGLGAGGAAKARLCLRTRWVMNFCTIGMGVLRFAVRELQRIETESTVATECGTFAAAPVVPQPT